MSFAHTGSGARFIVTWTIDAPSLEQRLGPQYPGPIPFERFTVTDDRGGRYDLDCSPGGDPEWTSEISLRPTPPQDIRWLDVAAPHRPAVRIDVRPGGPATPAGDEPQVSDTKLSPGEHLLVMLAERLLTAAPEFPHSRWRQVTAGPLRAMAGGLGDIVAALEAADVLSPLSPVPARLAALCASLDIGGHGITVAPASDLPEPWLSLLAYYQRRKPDPASMREGYAALAATLPELDGIRLALLGLQHTGEARRCTCWPGAGCGSIFPGRSMSTWRSRCRSGSGTAAAGGTPPARTAGTGPTASARSGCSWCRR